MDDVTLYSFWRSSSSWRVRIGLAWKGIRYRYQAVNLFKEGGDQWHADHLARSPLGKVPVLEWTEEGRLHRLTESMAILEYLDERFPEKPFLPADPYLRAHTRMLAEMVNSAMQPMQNLATLKYVKHVLKADETAWAAHWLGTGLVGMEQAAQETAGTYCVGDQPTLADIYLVPQMFGARRYGVDLATLPTLVRIEAACIKLTAFADAQPERQPDALPPTA
jgi:maleylpyruvate isomerase